MSWDFTKKKSGIFVSFPFSALRRERQLTLLILFYVNAGRSGWKLIPYKTNNEVCFSVVLRRRVSEIQKIGFINWVDIIKLATVKRSKSIRSVSSASPLLIVFVIQHFFKDLSVMKIQSNLNVQPPLRSDHHSKTPNVTQSKHFYWNLS